ncbi:MAG: hypothetical protein NZM41_11505, partial [Saprospiraceae bacterium]|nr:hypothetical protein [Saprospiraceae bacterium]
TPNPASSSLCLQVKEEWPHGLRLWSADGRLVFSEQASVATSCFDLPAALPAGVYAAEVVFADGYRVVQKVIVVR